MHARARASRRIARADTAAVSSVHGLVSAAEVDLTLVVRLARSTHANRLERAEVELVAAPARRPRPLKCAAGGPRLPAGLCCLCRVWRTGGSILLHALLESARIHPPADLRVQAPGGGEMRIRPPACRAASCSVSSLLAAAWS